MPLAKLTKKKQTNIFHEYRCNFATKDQQIESNNVKNNITQPIRIYLRYVRSPQYLKITQCNLLFQQAEEEKKHIVISINAEKAPQHVIHSQLKTQETRNKVEVSQLGNDIYKKASMKYTRCYFLALLEHFVVSESNSLKKNPTMLRKSEKLSQPEKVMKK